MGPKESLFTGSPYAYEDHERQHAKQGEILGPFFFLAYAAWGRIFPPWKLYGNGTLSA